MPDPVERRLAAIMFTDIVGYTALMAESEEKGLRVRERHRQVLRPLVEQYHGEWVQDIGDESLSIFSSAVDAVNCALAIQAALRDEPEFCVRVGLHLGDVVLREGSIHGDGVNVASRIRPLAEAGGICVSGEVYHSVRNQPNIEATPLGEHELKNVGRPVAAFTIRGQAEAPSSVLAPQVDRERGEPIQFLSVPPKRHLRTTAIVVGVVLVIGGARLGFDRDLRYRIAATAVINLPRLLPSQVDQDISATHSADGIRIAFATLGAGPPIVQVRPWMTHLELTARFNAEWLREFSARHRYVHYDGRGFGLSERGVRHSLAARVADLEAVIQAARVDRLALWAISAGAPVAVEYAARHPERVTRLAIYGAQGIPVASGVDRDTLEPTVRLMRRHWGSGNRAFHTLFRSMFVPDATDFELHVFDELSRLSATGADAAAFLESAAGTDIRGLAKEIRAPTLIFHRRDDPFIPFEASLELASLIPGARLLPLEGKNHLLLPRETHDLMTELEAFFDEDLPDE